VEKYISYNVDIMTFRIQGYIRGHPSPNIQNTAVHPPTLAILVFSFSEQQRVLLASPPQRAAIGHR
jgi:hypothetical protein